MVTFEDALLSARERAICFREDQMNALWSRDWARSKKSLHMAVAMEQFVKDLEELRASQRAA